MEAALTDSRRVVRMAGVVGLLAAGAAIPGVEPKPALTTAIEDHARRAGFLNDDAAVQLDLGKMFFLTSNWKGAEASLRDALHLDPAIASGSYFLGLATLGQGRVEEARSLLKGVARNDPHRKDAEAMLSRLGPAPH